MEKLMVSSENEAVRNVMNGTPYLMDWSDRYYGVALQMLTVFVEHMTGFTMSYREIFLIRHAFTFINYFIAAFFFYLTLRRRFGDAYIPIAGLLFFILYPRFFGESFYNIKDILFFSWCVISSYFTLRWLEDDAKKAFIVPAAITLAVATNTRILGISILLLALGFAILQGLVDKEVLRLNLKKSVHLILMTFVSFVVITPFTWENPIRNSINIFFHFLRFQPWNWTHFYMGEMITREVPWHYIPVWMGITIPLLYIVMFFIGFFAIIYVTFKKGDLDLYDLFFFTMFSFTLLGFIILRINMYEGWRHIYSLFLPFLYITVYGLYYSYAALKKLKWVRKGFVAGISAYLIYLLMWMIINHPYQYVYFNLVGRQFAEENFTLDYWYVSNTDLIRYALNSSEEPILNFAVSPFATRPFLTEEESARTRITDIYVADFYVRGSRLDYTWRTRPVPEGFYEYKAIMVGGMRISTLFRYQKSFSPVVDADAMNKVINFESNIRNSFHYLFDGDADTRWATGRPQRVGDHLIIEFNEAVNYNYIFLNQSWAVNDYPRNLAIYISADGDNWVYAPIKAVSQQSHFVFNVTEEYTRIKLVTRGYSEYSWWTIFDIDFGYVD